LPEFNPFKYNSFPVNGAWQSHRLTQALQQQIAATEVTVTEFSAVRESLARPSPAA